MKVASYSATGSKHDASVTLDKAVFEVELNKELVAQAYQAYLNNGRSAHAATLTRGLVRGGGKKPWRQKGTGRARVGSSRVPHWRGGGVTFGPTGHENYQTEMNVKMKRAAIRQALSAQAKDGRVIVIDALDFSEGKTRAAFDLINKMKLTGRTLLVVDQFNDFTDRATRNLADVHTVQANYLNVFTVMNADNIVLTKPSVEAVTNWLGVKS